MWECGTKLTSFLATLFTLFWLFMLNQEVFGSHFTARQKFAEHGWVAGSEITTAGLKRAFEALSWS